MSVKLRSTSMLDNLDPELLQQLAAELGRQRGYASFHQYSVRKVMERGIVKEALPFLPNEFPGPVQSVDSPDRDPPDCVVTTSEARIGVEVTELVDQAHLEAVVRAKRAGVVVHDWAAWDREKFLEFLENRISAKAEPAEVFGGPYDEYVLLVHTAEPGLDPSTVRGWLENSAPVDLGVFSSGHILFDYRPHEGGLLVRLPGARACETLP